jgi:hypothetical protein
MMATKKQTAEKPDKKRVKADTEPKFPYTTKPSSLRRLLQDIPKKPRPPKFDKSLLRAWGFTDANDYSMLRVLKSVGLLNANNEPTLYSRYMHLEGGAVALAEPLRRIYEPLFHASHAPYKESNDRLQNLFNIHSGSGERALEQQIQTFKALAENTVFDGANVAPSAETGSSPSNVTVQGRPMISNGSPVVHIDLHIHLPENKSRRDYEAIIEDIGRFIFGRESEHRNE